MKNSAKWYLSLAFAGWALFISAPVQAQAQHHGNHQGMDIEKLKSDLNLTDNQVAEIEALKAKFKSEREAGDLKRQPDRDAMKEIREAHKEAFEAILTPEQITRFEEIKSERKADMEKHKAVLDDWKKNELPAMKAELKSYNEENVIPVLKEKRLELDQEISAADKVRIDELRKLLSEFHKERKSMKESLSREELKSDAAREAHRQKMEASKPIMEEAKTLAVKYDNEISEIMESLAENRTEWESDIKEIRKKYAPSEKEDKAGKSLERKEGHKGHWKKDRMNADDKAARNRDKSKVKFLLMNPDGKTKARVNENNGNQPNVQVYPNPFGNSTTIEYEIIEPGKIRLELHDSQGILVRTLLNGYKEAGKFKYEIDLSDLREAIYFVVLTDSRGVNSKKLVKGN